MSKIRNIYWNPIVPLCPLVYFIARSSTSGVSSFRAFALFSIAVWFVLAVYDRFSKGKFTNWLYSDDK